MTQSFVLRQGPDRGRSICAGHPQQYNPRLIAVTGGPGAGKTAILQLATNTVCSHVAFLPEAATLIFSGGFWRRNGPGAIASTQRAIFTVQRELETIFLGDGLGVIGLCDRGTVDGMAYWPQGFGDYWLANGVSREEELNRYAGVLHLRTPNASAYNHDNPSRIEDLTLAHRIDEAILKAWDGHPKRIIIEAFDDFQVKADLALKALRELMAD